MNRKLLHVYRNTPLGRETLLQSAAFCRAIGCRLEVYVPEHRGLLLYVGDAIATVELDGSYLREPATARDRVRAIASEARVAVEFVEADGLAGPDLPGLRADHAYMTCPRSMSELSDRLRFGHIGPRVRSIVTTAPFPVLLPTPVYKPWERVVACFGGSANSARALVRADRIARDAGVPLSVFTWSEGRPREELERTLAGAGFPDRLHSTAADWLLLDTATLEEALFAIPRDALIVAGAYGHGPVREALFGSKPETIQSEVPNNLLLVGPRAAPLEPPGDAGAE